MRNMKKNAAIALSFIALSTMLLHTSCTDVTNDNNGNETPNGNIYLNCQTTPNEVDANVSITRTMSGSLAGKQIRIVEANYNYVSDNVQTVLPTRGTMIDAITDLDKNTNIDVYGYMRKNSFDTEAGANNFTGTVALNKGELSRVLVNGTAKQWDSNTPFTQIAGMYPAKGTTNCPISNFKRNGNTFIFDYTAKNSCIEQTDVMLGFAQQQYQQGQDPHPTLVLKHALTAINFAIGNNLPVGQKLTGIRMIDDRGNEATCTVSVDANGVKSFAWDKKAGTTTYGLKLEKAINVDDITAANTVLTGNKTNGKRDNLTFFVMPRKEGKVTFKLKFTNNKNQHSELAFTVDKPNWQAGHTITYTLDGGNSVNNYIFTKDVSAPVVANEQDEVAFNLTSCKALNNTQKGTFQRNCSWEVKGYEYDGKKTPTSPEWFEIAQNGDGSVTPSQIKAKFIKDKIAIEDLLNGENGMNKYLQKNKIDQNKPYNLAGENGTDNKMSSANCYIIEGPGWYKIPLVYGNALKNGNENATSYKNGNYFPTHVYDKENNYDKNIYGNGAVEIYKDRDYIKKAWIKDNGKGNGDVEYAPASGAILWWDGDFNTPGNIANDFNVTDGGKYLTFRVTDKIKNSNAVIAVKNKAGKVMWSWHLWFTDKRQLQDFDMNNETILSQNLGWKLLNWKGKPEKSITVTFRQKDSGKELTTTFMRRPNYTEMKGICPEYQTFRKDPFSLENTCKRDRFDTAYNMGECKRFEQRVKKTEGVDYGTVIICYGVTIQNPSTLYYGGGLGPNNENDFLTQPKDPTNTKIDMYWDKEKTVYDPCPAGYHLPSADILKYLSTKGKKQNALNAWEYDFDGRKLYLPHVGILWGSNNLRGIIEFDKTRYGSYDGYQKGSGVNHWKRSTLRWEVNKYDDGRDVPLNGMPVRPMKETSK